MKYTGRDHIRVAYPRSVTDRVPVYAITSLINAKVVGITVREYLTSPGKFARAVIGSYERFRGDVVTMMADLVMETEACGSVVEMPENDLAYIPKHILDDKKKFWESEEVKWSLRRGGRAFYLTDSGCHFF